MQISATPEVISKSMRCPPRVRSSSRKCTWHPGTEIAASYKGVREARDDPVDVLESQHVLAGGRVDERGIGRSWRPTRSSHTAARVQLGSYDVLNESHASSRHARVAGAL